ncbi:vWA domain-containing protein [Alkalilacustris brevis]|uniref:vWA domain-containing protein n=1 Tax=Alkalilacustris brevis TaxID=2026338 RepID=UPI000E0D80D0|nr:VWA domain-containing protein [Alkalilacustris brevis]
MRGGVAAFPAREGGPAGRVAGFIAHLRANGMALGPGETRAALQALSQVSAGDSGEVRAALKALCCGTREEFARFDDLFAAYWFNRGRERARPAGAPKHQTTRRRARLEPLAPQAADAAGEAERPDAGKSREGEMDQQGEGRLIAARMRNLARVDLRELVTPEDIAEAERVAERLARAIRDRRSRRRRAAARGVRLDMRRIMRSAIATGGEPLRLHWRRRVERPAQLVAICDVSGSMSVYARVFLAFLRGLTGADARTDAYLFHTRLVRITDALRDRDTLRAVNRLSLLAQGFGGGTRIGGNLAAFNRAYAQRLVSGRSVVMILSDGYDSDPPELLAQELARLRKRGCRIVWLNPLKGWKDYAPVAAGMAAALPHLDLFAAANTLEALAALEPEFARL